MDGNQQLGFWASMLSVLVFAIFYGLGIGIALILVYFTWAWLEGMLAKRRNQTSNDEQEPAHEPQAQTETAPEAEPHPATPRNGVPVQSPTLGRPRQSLSQPDVY